MKAVCQKCFKFENINAQRENKEDIYWGLNFTKHLDSICLLLPAFFIQVVVILFYNSIVWKATVFFLKLKLLGHTKIIWHSIFIWGEKNNFTSVNENCKFTWLCEADVCLSRSMSASLSTSVTPVSRNNWSNWYFCIIATSLTSSEQHRLSLSSERNMTNQQPAVSSSRLSASWSH